MVNEATITEVSVMDLPNSLEEGTAQKRRALVSIRYTSAAASDTITLATYVPNVADVEGVVWDSMNSAVAATSVTWSTTTITAAGDTGAHLGELGIIVSFT